MIAPPYFVFWAFVFATIVVLILSISWLFIPSVLTRLLNPLETADATIYWIGFAAIHHTYFFYTEPLSHILDDKLTLPLIWVCFALFFLIRFALRIPAGGTIRLLVGLLIWAWLIGGGFQYVERMEDDLSELSLSIKTQDQWPSSIQRLIQQGLFINRMPEPEQEGLQELHERFLNDTSETRLKFRTDDRNIALALQQNIQNEINRLSGYQIMQSILLGGVLIAWGFGRKPDPSLSQ